MFDYAQLRDGVFSIVAQLDGTVRDVTSKSLGETKTKLEEEAFNLVVLGQFKRGKSTFINALLGESILPTAITPLTSVVTILRYAPKLKVEVGIFKRQNGTNRSLRSIGFHNGAGKSSKQEGSQRSTGLLPFTISQRWRSHHRYSRCRLRLWSQHRDRLCVSSIRRCWNLRRLR